MRPTCLPGLLTLLFACKDKTVPPLDDSADETPTDDSAPDSAADSGDSADTDSAVPVAPGSRFDRWCGAEPWDGALEAAEVNDPGGGYAGYISSYADFKRGTLETMKIIPSHPFYVESLKVAFAAGVGTARLRLMTTFGRSYPGGWPDLDTDGVNLIEPVDVEVDTSSGRQVVELDLSGEGVFLEPGQHYMLVNQYIEKGGPTIGIVSLNSGEGSRALLMLPDEDTPYGIDGNYNMALEGQYFCEWSAADRLFEEDLDTPFVADVSAYIAVVDLNKDGHDDILTYPGTPTLYWGDGDGGYSLADPSPWPEAETAGMLVFGDVDNDGDEDAFAGTYTSADGDGDGYTLAEGDCSDADAAINPGATESTNGYDDDCDGIADDGADISDADADGFSVADGDCDDTRLDMNPDAPELHDSRDNDCDGTVDEDFASRMLLNDGTGLLSPVPVAGLEVIEPTTAGSFGDANEDGYLDLYFGNWLEHYPDDAAVQDRYYTGNGDGTFTDALAAAGLELPTPWSVYGVEWTDYNNDGHMDIFVGNYHLYDNQLWQNQGDGSFVDVAPEVGVDHDEELSPYAGYPGGHTYGADFADVDNDGDLDVYIANLAHPRTQPWGDPSMFCVNSGAPDYTYENARESYGFVYDEGDVNVQFADYDNDMDMDIAIASLYTQHYARVYRNDGEAGFTDVTYETGVNVEESVSVIWLDADEDGDEDLLLADRSGAPYVHLFTNRIGQENHWVNLVLEGTSTNRDAVGARVTLSAGGVSQIRDVTGGNGHWNTQKSRTQHFGLASNTDIDTVTVHWVGGATESFSGVGSDATWRLIEGSGLAVSP